MQETTIHYINTNEIRGELSGENLISSRVKIIVKHVAMAS